MSSLYGLEGLRALLGERKRELVEEADRERQARKARRPAKPAESAGPGLRPATSKPEIAWGPWLQGGEPLHPSEAGYGLN